MSSKWRRDLDKARPWLLLQFVPLAVTFAIVGPVLLPSPYAVIFALVWLALVCFMIMVTVRRHRANRGYVAALAPGVPGARSAGVPPRSAGP